MHAPLRKDRLGVTQAPPPLDAVQAFLNTRDIEAGEDALGTSEGFVRWSRTRGHAMTAVSDAQLARAREVREALRDLVRGGDDDRSAAAVCSIDRAIRELGIRPAIGDGLPPSLVDDAAEGDRACATLLSVALAAMSTDRWARLRICVNDDCGWAFYDSSRNRSGRWCSARMCGSVMNARAYRARQRAEPPLA